MRSLLESGTFVKPAAMPNEAIIKKTTWLEKPDKAELKLGTVFITGIKAKKVRHVTVSGRASVTSIIKKAADSPKVFICMVLRLINGGRKHVNIIIVAERSKPVNCFIFIVNSECCPALYFKGQDRYFYALAFISSSIRITSLSSSLKNAKGMSESKSTAAGANIYRLFIPFCDAAVITPLGS